VHKGISEVLTIEVAHEKKKSTIQHSNEAKELKGDSVVLALNRDPLYWWRKFAATIVMTASNPSSYS
jgi:hypothetical protein